MIAVAAPAAPAAPPTTTTPRHISPTSARSYLSCGLRFFFEKVAGIKKPVAAGLHCGKAVHAALQAFHLALWRGGDSSPAAAGIAYEEAFDALERDEGPVGYEDPAERDKARADGLRIVAAYLDSPEALKERPRGVEVILEETLLGLSVPLTGTIDLVRADLTPVDFKSSSSKPDPTNARFEAELQLVSYQLLLEAATGERPRGLELVYLVKTKTPQVIRVQAKAADLHRKHRAIAMLEAAAQGIASERFLPSPGMQCSWCGYRKECWGWKGGAP